MKAIEIKADDWIEGKGYKKQILASPDELECEGCLAQVVEIKPGAHVAPHYHEKTYEYYYVISGEVTFTINQSQRVLRSGDMMVTEPNDVHSVKNASSQDFRILVFKTNSFPEDTVWLDS